MCLCVQVCPTCREEPTAPAGWWPDEDLSPPAGWWPDEDLSPPADSSSSCHVTQRAMIHYSTAINIYIVMNVLFM